VPQRASPAPHTASRSRRIENPTARTPRSASSEMRKPTSVDLPAPCGALIPATRGPWVAVCEAGEHSRRAHTAGGYGDRGWMGGSLASSSRHPSPLLPVDRAGGKSAGNTGPLEASGREVSGWRARCAHLKPPRRPCRAGLRQVQTSSGRSDVMPVYARVGYPPRGSRRCTAACRIERLSRLS